MYNGIGLTTPRGSGTNGYVQRNLGALPKRIKIDYQKDSEKNRASLDLQRKPNTEILEHERRRQIEIKVEMLKDTMIAKNFSEDEIEERAGKLRQELLSEKSKKEEQSIEKNLQETHQYSQAKEKHNAKLKEAFAIPDSHVEGTAFDHEEQEKKKELRKAEREQREKEREQRKKELLDKNKNNNNNNNNSNNNNNDNRRDYNNNFKHDYDDRRPKHYQPSDRYVSKYDHSDHRERDREHEIERERYSSRNRDKDKERDRHDRDYKEKDRNNSDAKDRDNINNKDKDKEKDKYK